MFRKPSIAVTIAAAAAIGLAGCGGSSGPSPAQRQLDAATKKYRASLTPLKTKMLADAKANNFSALTSDFAAVSSADSTFYETVKSIHFPSGAQTKLATFERAEAAALQDLMGIESATSNADALQFMNRFNSDHTRAVAAEHALRAAA
jgi:hypothetical protein